MNWCFSGVLAGSHAVLLTPEAVHSHTAQYSELLIVVSRDKGSIRRVAERWGDYRCGGYRCGLSFLVSRHSAGNRQRMSNA